MVKLKFYYHISFRLCGKELEKLNSSDREIIQVSEQGKNNEKDENTESDEDESTRVEESKMIEMDVTIGDMDSNPLYNSLLSEEDKEYDSDKINNNGNELRSQTKSQTNTRSKITCVSESTSELIKDTKEKKLVNNIETVSTTIAPTNNDHSEPIFMTEISSKRRKK